jgi:carboxyl-terminal processing protease
VIWLPPTLRLFLFSTVVASATALACGVASERAATVTPRSAGTETPEPATEAPAGTPTPDLAVLLQDGGVSIVQAAYDRLLDEYIDPVEPSRLLDGAWTSMVQQAGTESLEVPLKPTFSDDRASDFELFRGAYVKLASGSADPTTLRHAAIRGMAATLQDCHTFFLTPVLSDTLIESRAGRGTVGIGVELAGVPPLVTEVITGSPADRAGVLVGDRIVAVDGADTSQFGPNSTLGLVNGDPGTTVRFTLLRADGSRSEVEATRERVNPPNMDARVLDGGIGYVRIRHFVDGGIAEELRGALEGFETQGVTSWIIDLRGNPGGRLDYAAFSLFVPSGVIVRDRDRNGVVNEEVATGDGLPTLRPTSLIVNNRTGSVAEAFAAALQEYGVARVFGATTNGCVGYTDVREFGDGSSMAVTTHVNLGPVSGNVLNGVGVVPDEAVARTEDDIANARDPQLDAAIAYLSELTPAAPAGAAP